MTPDQAADLAVRTLAAIDRREALRPEWHPMTAYFAADRERVASDLAGLRDHQPGHYCVGREHWRYFSDGPAPVHCPDARRYADGLRLTAALYGVTP